jgi:hypothetical protein
MSIASDIPLIYDKEEEKATLEQRWVYQHTNSVSEADLNLNLEDNCPKQNTVINNYHFNNAVPT